MSKKDDMLAALRRNKPEGAVPIWELEFQAWDAASGRHMVLGHEFEALTDAGKQRAMEENADILLSVAREFSYAALSTPNGFWCKAPGELADYCLPGEWRFEQTRILRERCPGDLMLVSNASAILSANYSPDFCEQMFAAPETIDAQAAKSLAGGLELAKRLRDVGVEAVFTASDIADNSGPFFNPRQMERWILPNLAAWAEAIHKMGMFALLHSDGNLMPYLDNIANTGIDALQAIDPVAGMDMGKSLDIAGNRLTLCGNVDCGLLLTGTPEKVFEATRMLLETARGRGSLILGASNAVEPVAPIENYRAMIGAWERFGKQAGENEHICCRSY